MIASSSPVAGSTGLRWLAGGSWMDRIAGLEKWEEPW
jgi:hypothetical protein